MEQTVETRCVNPNGVATNTIINKRPSIVHWITVSVSALGTQAAIQLYDGFDNKGDLKWVLEPGYSRQNCFCPAILCDMGIFVANDSHVSTYVVGYTVVEKVPFKQTLHPL